MSEAVTTIVFADALPTEGAGLLVHYDHDEVSAARWETVDLRQVISSHEDTWLAEIDAWHRLVSEQGAALTRWWWLLPGSRMAAWYPVPLKPVIVAMAIVALGTDQPGQTVWVVGAPADTQEYIFEWAGRHDGMISVRRAPLLARAHRHAPAAGRLEEFRRQARELASVIRRAFAERRSSVPPAGAVVWSHTLDYRVMRRSGDHFFGRMLDDTSVQPAQGVLWYYQLTSSADRAVVAHQLAADGRRSTFDGALFHWSDLWFAARAARVIWRASRRVLAAAPPLVAGGLQSRAFARHFLERVARTMPLQELLTYRAIRRVLEVSGARVLMYPYEEKGLERAMLLAAADVTPPAQTIGFAHAAYSKGHRFVRRERAERQPRPSTLAVTGDAPRQWFENAGVPGDRLAVIGTPRFRARAAVNPPRRASLRALFIAGFPSELRMFASAAAQHPSLMGEAELLVRPYPYGWHEAREHAESRLRLSGVPFTIVTGDLGESIDAADVVLYASTSAGLEAILRGRIAIRLAVDDVVTADPLEASPAHERVVPTVRPLDLAAELSRLRSLSDDAWFDLARRQHEAAVSVYGAPREREIGRLLSGAAASAASVAAADRAPVRLGA